MNSFTDKNIKIVYRKVFDFCFTACNSDMQISPERHDYFEVVITLSNNYIHTVNGRSYQPEVGDVVILRPQDFHGAKPIDDSSEHICRDVYFEKPLFREACDYISPTLYDTIMIADGPPSYHLSAEALASLNQRLSAPMLYISATDYRQYKALTRTFATEIISYYVFNQVPADEQLPLCISRLLLKLQDKEFLKKDLSDMAAEIGYSRDHLCRLFKAHFGKTLLVYLKEKRIFDSMPYLLQSDLSVEEIASLVGWEDVGNYIKYFKRIYGSTPSKYRKDLENKYTEQGKSN